MEKYEFMFILRVDMPDTDRDQAITNIRKDIENIEGKVTKEDTWGKKRLAYPINAQNEGYYFIWNVELPKSASPAFKKKLELSSEILRAQLIKESDL